MKHFNHFLLITISIISSGCFCVQKLSQSKLNPTQYVFPISKYALIDSLLGKKFLYFKHRDDNPIFYHKDSDYYEVSFSQGSRYKNYGGSYVYRKKNGGKPASYKFKMYIDSVAQDSCRVRLIYAKGYLFAPVVKLGDMWMIRYKPIPATTIEEYEILRYFGKCYGSLNEMPLVNYPEGLTRDQIRITYGYVQQFTYEEMFGEPQPESEKDPVYTEKELKKRKRKGLPISKFNYKYCIKK